MTTLTIAHDGVAIGMAHITERGGPDLAPKIELLISPEHRQSVMVTCDRVAGVIQGQLEETRPARTAP